ncbi:MAG: ureidoglycolate lyase [Rhizobiaceae bacterium]
MKLISKPLTKDNFRAYGDVIEKAGSENFKINNGNCTRHNDLCRVEITGSGGEVGINIFTGQPYALPLALSLVERHPLGSQAFYPLGSQPWLVIVCEDDDGTPVRPTVFTASPNQGINLHRGVWHGVLTPLYKASDFLVVDRVGEGSNLEEHTFDVPFIVDIN